MVPDKAAPHMQMFLFVGKRVLFALIRVGAFGLICLALGSSAQVTSAPDQEVLAPGASSGMRADGSIRPFRISVPEDQLIDLRRRIAATKRPGRETVSDAPQGVQLGTMQKLAQHGETDYDWRKAEAKLNALPQFVTTIDGLEIHFIHVRSKNANALPIIITHGWPGCIRCAASTQSSPLRRE